MTPPSARAPEDLARAFGLAGVTDGRLLRAVRETPREHFVPPELVPSAYQDVPLPIGHGQVTTQPSLSGMMIEGLGLDGDEHVLEVGTGLGFQTALLARLAADVVSVEMWQDIAERARRNLDRRGVGNVEVVVGDGSRGVPERAPYDAVVVSAAFAEVPEPLIRQLRVGGALVQPIGPGGREQVTAFRRTGAGLEFREVLAGACFVPLRGRYGYHV
ncbi:protein-L-isoaspartate(D-aspartate) O-methyltransferase [Streptomyces sp. WMMB 322]|uniref:protein-L-isoaspartate(D-aspartate) O-methyltransferase n=1 Tax=Streptomyces sp. WMMB 322 TaxID=1286821 RepID=UPI0006E301CC|nr:protein-L-isoaspartate(D-aspartate) O-methyltransferase [Streptomyces sp. WMMB 322]SCK43664.1 protein-L-isoaspartate(D-aspartate) O-methyltransferase [Streptomyces sp. WMMB 322]